MRTFRRKREHTEDLDASFSCKSYSVSKYMILVLLLKPYLIREWIHNYKGVLWSQNKYSLMTTFQKLKIFLGKSGEQKKTAPEVFSMSLIKLCFKKWLIFRESLKSLSPGKTNCVECGLEFTKPTNVKNRKKGSRKRELTRCLLVIASA